ncbi:MAG: hypothetical protein JWL70_745 [Acidimicrobiia bacterium]|nr:hypothetical protein [Acidimicrobiia bacterium]
MVVMITNGSALASDLPPVERISAMICLLRSRMSIRGGRSGVLMSER